ncbi:MAG: hypothetical protein NZM41_11975 [Saprospiraceae bacterium]|nr:hypothetical protein [Saprospiraceae bacterium]
MRHPTPHFQQVIKNFHTNFDFLLQAKRGRATFAAAFAEAFIFYWIFTFSTTIKAWIR